MDYCTECGCYFFRASGRPVTRAVGARGALTEPQDSICLECRDPSDVFYRGQWYDGDGPMAEVARLEELDV